MIIITVAAISAIIIGAVAAAGAATYGARYTARLWAWAMTGQRQDRNPNR